MAGPGEVADLVRRLISFQGDDGLEKQEGSML